MSVIETLTEGIRQRSLAREGEALLDKWGSCCDWRTKCYSGW